MLDNQLNRRNLTDKHQSYLRGMRMELEQQREGAPEGNKYASKQLPQNEGVVTNSVSL